MTRPGISESFETALALHQQGRLSEAETLYRAVVKDQPDHFDAHSLLGVLASQRKDYAAAAALFNRAVALNPRSALAHAGAGNALFALRRFDEALARYTRSLDIRPGSAEVLFDRGNTFLSLGRPDKALTDFEHALSAKTDYPEALNNSGNALLALGRGQEALARYDRALRVRPDFAEALYNRGTALSALSRHGEAARDYAHLLTLRPDFPYARGDLLYARLHCCDWTDYRRTIGQIQAEVAAGRRSATPFAFLSASDSPRDQLQCARIYTHDNFPASERVQRPVERSRHDRIRVAYISADFYDHPTAYLTAELFELHDRSRFETYAVSLGPNRRDDMRIRLESAFSHFIDARGRSDDEVASLLRRLEIDIAVDLKGHTQHSRPRIFAARAAPLQVSYLGYPGTTGADFIDYVIADRFTIPDEHRQFYSEQVVRLPHTYQPTDSKRRISQWTPQRREVGLPESGFVFASLGAGYKIVPDLFDCWMRLLTAINGSVLWLLSGNEDSATHLRRAAAARGVAPERLVFAPRMKWEHHLARQSLADLFLDTQPINAHTTASDALWAGLPVVTCLGGAFAGRVAASLLNAVGLPELVTENPGAYEALALELARNGAKLAQIRAKLARHRTTHALFDTDRLRHHIESAFRTMYLRHQRGEPAAGFDVEDSVPTARLQKLAALLNANRHADLEHQCRELLNRHPTSGVLWQILGISLARQGKDALPAAQRAALLLPDDAGAQVNWGNALGRQGRFEDAARTFHRALVLNPQSAEAHQSLGHVLLHLGQNENAAVTCRRALELKPDCAETHHNLGAALLALGKLDEALASSRRAIDIDPNFADAHCTLGIVLRLMGRTGEAQAACRRALAIDPQLTAAMLALAECHADEGQFTAAEESFRQVARMAPDSSAAWAGIARSRKMTRMDTEWLSQAQRIAAGTLSFRQEIPLRYAIGKYFDDIQEFELAFENFHRANELAKRNRDAHDRRGLTQLVDQIIRRYDPEWLNNAAADSNPSPRPVFIVGMLRSGTTLLEQILASHPSVFGAGELTFWSTATPTDPASMAGVAPGRDTLHALAHEYLRLLGDLSGDALRVIDKMPTNFAFLGLIHAALPNARIIHMQRDPLDTCLSIYCQHFESAISYANDLDDLAHYYGEYLRLMRHWQSLLPKDAMLNVRYEDLVEDPERWSRAALNFIGLPWDPRCLEPQGAHRTVVTASKWQVRQKINASSVGRWRRYEKFMGPLLRLTESDASAAPAARSNFE